ncbi:unnamed protein product, partial [Cladocopium goreaui]
AAWENWGESPRRRAGATATKSTASPRRRTRGRTPKKTSAAKESYGAPTLDPPWQSASTTSLPQPSTSTPVETPESALLKELVQALENTGNSLTEDVQTVIDKTKKPYEPPPSTKSVRQSWDKLEKKRKQLQQAQTARSNLHSSWAGYIEESVKRWKTFASDFAEKDQALEKKVLEAKDAMQEAREKYEKARDAMDKQDAAQLEVEEVSDGMEEESADRIAQWVHSILEEPTFLTEWKASISALDLSYEVSQHCGTVGTLPVATRNRSRSRRSSLQVTFSPIAELYVGSEQDFVMQRTYLTLVLRHCLGIDIKIYHQVHLSS